MCRSVSCLLLHEGKPVYSDNSHPAWSASPFYADMLERGVVRGQP
jgi:hypothetical protein